MKSFFHSGDLSGIIYALPAIMTEGKSDLITSIDKEQYFFLHQLIGSQPYILEFSHLSDASIPSKSVCFDAFRRYPDVNTTHLVDSHLKVIGIVNGIRKYAQWLFVDPMANFDRPPYCIINRTKRHQDFFCNWARELAYLRKLGRVYFIGSESEHYEFCFLFGQVDYIHVKNAYHAAQLILDAEEFTGNQSLMLAIAQGLGRSYRIEQSPGHSNCNTKSDRETIINPLSMRFHRFFSTIKEAFSGMFK